MSRLPRILPSLAMACVLAAPVVPSFAQEAPPAAPAPAAPAAPAPAAPAPAAPAPAAPAAPEAPPVNPELLKQVDDFFHYASIARYDLAKTESDKFIDKDPLEVLRAFEQIVAKRNAGQPNERRVELYERLLSWQRVKDLRDPSAKILTVLNKGRFTRRADPNFIEQNVLRLSTNARAYELGLAQLRESGELAVPVLITHLRAVSSKQHHVAIRRALRDLGVKSLNPLLAATSMKDWDTLPAVLSALADIGYDNAVPYIARVAQDKEAPQTVKDAAQQALVRLNAGDPKSLSVAQLYYDLAEKFYYERASVTVEPGSAVGYIWSWGPQGLTKLDVPAATFNEDMALRSAESALRADASRADAVSLWLAAGYKREAEATADAKDAFWPDGHPATHYYAVSAGTAHLNVTLARALHDHNAAVALKAIRSLQEIAGTSNLFTDQTASIIEALHYGDRQVRFEAALTAAASLPQKAFPEQERVVPILAEALSQTGKAGVLILAPSEQRLNEVTGALAGTYNVKGGQTADAAINAASALPAVDAIVIADSDALDAAQIERLLSVAGGNLRLERAARVVLAKSDVQSPFAARAVNDPLFTVAKSGDPKDIAPAVEKGRARAGALPLDEKLATQFALRAADALGKLAISRGQILDLSLAQSGLLAALDDARPELVKASGQVLALLPAKEAQAGLLAKAADEKTPDEMKISLLKDVATSAKFFGNQLEPAAIDSLNKLVEASASLDVRAAAAEAHGALNLPPEQSKTLILGQSKP